MLKIGIFGGSFNPPHIGHTEIAKYFVTSNNLEKIIFVPAFISPFKQDKEELFTVESADRINMLKLAIEDIPQCEICDYEIQKRGISYSIDTVKYFSKQYQNAQIYLLIGLDNALAFDKWKNHKEILEYVSLSIVARDNIIDDSILNKLNSIIGKNNFNIINAPLIKISSSELRYNIENAKDIDSFILPQVKDYINKYRLYR